jgi:hypothetical protein
MKALSTLKLYCNNQFPHYHKVKVLMGQAVGSSETELHSNIGNVVQCMESLAIGSHFPTTQLPSQPPQASSHVWSGNTLSFAPSTSSAWRMPQSAPATPSSTYPSQQHSASSHASGSQRPDSAKQTIQIPLRLEPHPSHQSSTSSTHGCMGHNPASHDDSSLLFPEIEGPSSAVLVGVADVMNHLTSNIRPPYETTKEAMEFVAAEGSLSEEERATLCIYYGKHMTEAAALSLMGDSLQRAVFRKVLEGLPSDK